ncbi:hypothetical protein [Roseisolibacter agri]|uniref:Uncharacterized protein n=1 Tax=Roseisolibacter agri TaxID=2014610 RepID=A0AA37Q2K4_9BACT|nr:hypothetical protein [Roseisolibacter agri]GLC25224.1 hypothetical protein rosag_17370 [Roseisolibacter agri]
MSAPSRSVATPAPLDSDTPTVAWDASAYRALARAADGDVAAVREAARAAAARERAAGLTPAASPFALWPLLAEAFVPPDDDAPRKRRTTATKSTARTAAKTEDVVPAAERRAIVARLALAACAAHCAPETPAPQPVRDEDDERPVAAPLPVSIDDPETLLVQITGGKLPTTLAAWNGYLLSVAAELGADPTPARAQRLSGPLDHVRERAAFAEGEFGDEMQDAIVAAYDAAANEWDDATTVGERQDRVAGGAEGLVRAVLAGRAARAEQLGAVGAERAAAHIATACAPGIALWREVVSEVVRGDVELEGAAWRRTLWTLQLAFTVGGAPRVLVTADPIVRDAAARAGVDDRVRGGDA